MDNSNNNKNQNIFNHNNDVTDANSMEQILKSLPPDLAKLALQGIPEAASLESSTVENIRANKDSLTVNEDQAENTTDDHSLDSALENLQDDVSSMFNEGLDEEPPQELTEEPLAEIEDINEMTNTVSASSIKFKRKKKVDWTRIAIYCVSGIVIGIMCFISIKMNENLSRVVNDDGKTVHYTINTDGKKQKIIDDARKNRINAIENPVERYNYLVNKEKNYEATKYLAKIIEEKGENREAIIKLIDSLPKGSDKNIRKALQRVDEEYEHKDLMILSLLASRELDSDKKANILKNMVALDANDTNAGIQLIEYYYKLNELNEALAMCENVISSNIDAPLEVFQNKAELLVLLGREKEAKTFFEKILETRGSLKREEQLVCLLNIFMFAKKSNYVDGYLKELNKVSDKRQLKKYFVLYRTAVFSTIKRDAFFNDDLDWDIYSKPFFVITLMQSGNFVKLSTMPNSKNEFPAIWNIYSNWKLNTVFWQDNASLIAQGKVKRDKVEVLFSKLILGQITIDNYMKKQNEISLPLRGKFLFFAAEYYSSISDITNAKMCYKQSMKAPGNIYRGVIKARLKKLK